MRGYKIPKEVRWSVWKIGCWLTLSGWLSMWETEEACDKLNDSVRYNASLRDMVLQDWVSLFVVGSVSGACERFCESELYNLNLWEVALVCKLLRNSDWLGESLRCCLSLGEVGCLEKMGDSANCRVSMWDAGLACESGWFCGRLSDSVGGWVSLWKVPWICDKFGQSLRCWLNLWKVEWNRVDTWENEWFCKQ